jgi:hypothetical protein
MITHTYMRRAPPTSIPATSKTFSTSLSNLSKMQPLISKADTDSEPPSTPHNLAPIACNSSRITRPITTICRSPKDCHPSEVSLSSQLIKIRRQPVWTISGGEVSGTWTGRWKLTSSCARAVRILSKVSRQTQTSQWRVLAACQLDFVYGIYISTYRHIHVFCSPFLRHRMANYAASKVCIR